MLAVRCRTVSRSSRSWIIITLRNYVYVLEISLKLYYHICSFACLSQGIKVEKEEWTVCLALRANTAGKDKLIARIAPGISIVTAALATASTCLPLCSSRG